MLTQVVSGERDALRLASVQLTKQLSVAEAEIAQLRQQMVTKRSGSF